jgi:hypothetical protein
MSVHTNPQPAPNHGAYFKSCDDAVLVGHRRRGTGALEALWPFWVRVRAATMNEAQKGGTVMQWDLGLQGLSVLGAMSLGFGVLAALLVGKGWTRRLRAAAITTLACFGVGLLTSEWLFGWAAEEDLQPNVDGLSRDEVLLSSLLTTALAVLVMRYLAHRAQGPTSHGGRHLIGRHRGHPVGHS